MIPISGSRVIVIALLRRGRFVLLAKTQIGYCAISIVICKKISQKSGKIARFVLFFAFLMPLIVLSMA